MLVVKDVVWVQVVGTVGLHHRLLRSPRRRSMLVVDDVVLVRPHHRLFHSPCWHSMPVVDDMVLVQVVRPHAEVHSCGHHPVFNSGDSNVHLRELICIIHVCNITVTFM